MLERVRSQEGYGESWTRMTAKYGEHVGGGSMALDLLSKALQDDPGVGAPRMEFCRRLLAAGEERTAMPHLEVLQARGYAEAAYFLGVIFIKTGEHRKALEYMYRARELNAEHEDTLKNIAMLEEIVAEEAA